MGESIRIKLRESNNGQWSGLNSQNVTFPGFATFDGGYVSPGGELRTFPGLKTVVDLSSLGRLSGFSAGHVDASRAVTTTSGQYQETNVVFTETQKIWNSPTHIHCFKFVRGVLKFVGESDFRRETIYASDHLTEIHVLSWDHGGTGGRIRLTVDNTIAATVDDLSPTGAFNSVSPTGAATCPSVVYLEGVDTSPASGLLNLAFSVFNVNSGAHQITLDSLVGTASGTFGPPATISRVNRSKTTLPASYYASPSGIDDPEALTVWTVVKSPDDANLTTLSWTAQVANRQRDFGDAIGNVVEGRQTLTGISRRRQRSIPYRVVPDVAGDRLLLAAPGYGCCFQVPVVIPIDPTSSPANSGDGIPWLNNSIYDRPRCIGIPKATMWEDASKSRTGPTNVDFSYHFDTTVNTANAFGGTSGNGVSRAGIYRFKIAYKDDATGEIGLPSEELVLDTTASDKANIGIKLVGPHPGYLMSETLALSVVIYRTQRGGSTFFYSNIIPLASAGTSVSAQHGLVPPTGGQEMPQWEYTIPFIDDATLALADGFLPVIEQMPMGAKTVKTVRGWTMYGGRLGNTGKRGELYQSTLSLDYDSAAGSSHPNPDEFSARSMAATSPIGLDGQWGCGQYNIPPAYEGQDIYASALYPYPRHLVTLDRLVNTVTNYDNTIPQFPVPTNWEQRYHLLETPLRRSNTLTNNSRSVEGAPAYMILPRKLYQISEQDNPGVTPATNDGFVDAELDDDIEGIGTTHGAFVMATRSKTFTLNFSVSPKDVPPDVVSEEFGCIAPNTMVEFEGGCAWISDRGPVAMLASGLEWIGRPLVADFSGEGARYKRDNQGMMRHAWACHDPDRSLIYFGVFADRATGSAAEVTVQYRGVLNNWTGSSDEARSRFPCDEILIYSYRTGSWSKYIPTFGAEVLWMDRGTDVAGNQRVYLLAADRRLYVLDDSYCDGNINQFGTHADGAGVNSNNLIVTAPFGDGTDIVARGSGDNFIRVGQSVAIVDAVTLACKGASTVVSWDIGLRQLNLADLLTWSAGDGVIVGMRQFNMSTSFINPGMNKSEVKAVTLKYNIASNNIGGFAYATVSVSSPDRVSPTPTLPLEVPYSGPVPDYIGTSDDLNNAREVAYRRGRSVGQWHQVHLKFLSGCQVRVSEIELEVAAS